MPAPSSPSVIVRIAAPDALQPLLPRMLDSLSIARGQLLVDQLAAIVTSKRLDELLLLVAETPTAAAAQIAGGGDRTSTENCVRAVVVLQTPELRRGGPTSSTATILFAGLIGPSDVLPEADAADVLGQSLGNTIDDLLSNRGVDFIQWAQDVSFSADVDAESQRQRGPDENLWPRTLGFRHLAELLYLRQELAAQAAPVEVVRLTSPSLWEGRPASGRGGRVLNSCPGLPDELAKGSPSTLPRRSRGRVKSKSPTGTPLRSRTISVEDGEHASPLPLRLARVAQELAATPSAFKTLVERTYAETLDCPELADMLSTDQIIDGYRLSPAYAPELWFEAWWSPSGSRADEAVVGCLILARHGEPLEQSTEIVYMGIVPEYRGRGLGSQLVVLAGEIARAENSESLILAVDQRNFPARAAYDAAGFLPIFGEEVWGKRLSQAKMKASKSEST